MPLPPKPVLRAADPNLSRVFDPWNSVGAGHQRPETKGPGGWRESRMMKMNHQLRAGNSGGKRVHDTVGAGSLEFDERLGVVVPKEVRSRMGNSVVDMLRRQASGEPAVRSSSEGGCSGRDGTSRSVSPGSLRLRSGNVTDADVDRTAATAAMVDGSSSAMGGDSIPPSATNEAENKRGIFHNLVIYVNGSTHPIISDHKLKHVLAENGARMALHLGRRQVTHVILGRPAAGSVGAGGGLAGGKLEKEIRRVGGVGVKYVGVEWVLESIKAGKRLPEARFSNLKVASKGQQSVYGLFGAGSTSRRTSTSSRSQSPSGS